MSYGCFCDKFHAPSEAEVFSALGAAAGDWNALAGFMTEEIGAKSNWKFYGKNYGWAMVFAKRGKSILSLYPTQGGFTVQMILKTEHEAEVVRIFDNAAVGEIIRTTPEIREGKWIFFAWSLLADAGKLEAAVRTRMK